MLISLKCKQQIRSALHEHNGMSECVSFKNTIQWKKTTFMLIITSFHVLFMRLYQIPSLHIENRFLKK